uniref:Uncharacterized protein n=1 Tax=Aegilops tauschii subsp. strangulata TaxID=200361 RepID=A0A453MYR6_AEGTS
MILSSFRCSKFLLTNPRVCFSPFLFVNLLPWLNSLRIQAQSSDTQLPLRARIVSCILCMICALPWSCTSLSPSRTHSSHMGVLWLALPVHKIWTLSWNYPLLYTCRISTSVIDLI